MDPALFIPVIYSIVLNGAVAASAWMAASRLPFLRNTPDRLLASFVFASVSIIISLELLGESGAIGILYTTIFHVMVLSTVLIAVRLTGGKVQTAGPEKAPAEKLSISMPVIRGIFWISFFIIASFALVMPPAPTDAFLDHLVFPAEWLQAGRITLVQTLSPDQATTYYPANGELLYLWLMLPLHDDLLVGLLEPFCLVVSVMAAYGIGRRIGLRKPWAATAAAAAGLVPVTANQMCQFGIDLFFTASFLCSVRFLLPDEEGRRPIIETLIAGLAAGLALGAKYLGVVLFLPLLPLIFAAKAERKKLFHVLIFVSAAAAAGAYWYIRNLAATGSPFYPLGMDFFGTTIFKGAYARDAMFRSYLHTPVTNLAEFSRIMNTYALGYWLLGGISVAILFAALRLAKSAEKTVVFLLPAIALAGVAEVLFLKSDSSLWGAILPAAGIVSFAVLVCIIGPKIEWHKRYLFCFAPIFVFIFWFLNPYNIANNARFLIPGIFVLLIFTGWVLQSAGWRRGWWLLAAGAPAGIFFGADSPAERSIRFLSDSFSTLGAQGWRPDAFALFIFCAVAVLLGLISLYLLLKTKPILSVIPLFLFIAAMGICIPLKSDHTLHYRYKWYGGHYLAPGWRAVSGIERPLTIAYAGNCSPYGLYGNGLEKPGRVHQHGRARGLAFPRLRARVQEKRRLPAAARIGRPELHAAPVSQLFGVARSDGKRRSRPALRFA